MTEAKKADAPATAPATAPVAAPQPAFLQKIRKAETLNQPKSILIYGDAGRGKTWLAASVSEVAEFGPVLLIDAEGGSSAIARDFKDVDVIQVETHQQFQAVYDWLSSGDHKYKTVIIDTIGVVMDRAEKFFGEKPENQGNKFGKWGDLKNWANEIFRSFHTAPFVSIVIAHALDDKDESTGAVKTTAMLPGSFKSTLPSIPDIVGYMTIEAAEDGTPQRVLIVGESSRLVTKNRFGLPGKISNPSMKLIMDTIKKGGK
jgi:phage nucleotide-binding protein